MRDGGSFVGLKRKKQNEWAARIARLKSAHSTGNDKSYLELAGEMHNSAGFVRNSAKDAEKPGARRIPRASSIYICNSVAFDRELRMKRRVHSCTCICVRIHACTKSAWIFQQMSIGDSNALSVCEHAILAHASPQQGRNRAKER